MWYSGADDASYRNITLVDANGNVPGRLQV
jgi:hypothetical protein